MPKTDKELAVEFASSYVSAWFNHESAAPLQPNVALDLLNKAHYLIKSWDKKKREPTRRIASVIVLRSLADPQFSSAHLMSSPNCFSSASLIFSSTLTHLPHALFGGVFVIVGFDVAKNEMTVVQYEYPHTGKKGCTVMVELTKDADKLLCLIYKEYLRRRSSGVSKEQAARFSTEGKTSTAFESFPSRDFDSTLTELKTEGLVKRYIYGEFDLDTTGIIYMEQRFPNGVSQVLEWMSKIKDAIPFA